MSVQSYPLRVRSGSGIGDNLYGQAIARELSKIKDVEVCTNFPELYPYPVKFSEFSRHNIDVIAHYSGRRREPTNQWEDVQITSGVKATLTIDWEPRNLTLLDSLPEEFVLVIGGRLPMGRKDGYGLPLLPSQAVFNRELRKVGLPAVSIGRGDRVYPVEVDIDLDNKTSLSDILDIAWKAKVCFGQIGTLVPLAEIFDKPATFIWSSRQPNHENWVINHLTPEKVLSKPAKVIYD